MEREYELTTTGGSMKPALFLVVASAFLVLLASVSVVAKNVSTGIYGIVDQVTLEPDADSPNFIRLSGVFVVPVALSSGGYHPPRRGYLYFRIALGTEQATRRDWYELKNFAGSGKVVGFGQYWVANPDDPRGNPHHSLEVQVHAEDGGSAAPDAYPFPQPRGVVEAKDLDKDSDPDSDKIAAQLRDFLHR
jgi:hypothetical protein